MATQIRTTFISKTLIDFLEDLGKQKGGQLGTKLLLSANLLNIIYKRFSTEEEFLKAIPYMADIENGILDDFLPAINLIKNDTDSRSPYYYDKIFLIAMFIAQELLFNLENQKYQNSEEYKYINRAVNEMLIGKLKDEPLEINEEMIDKLVFFQKRRGLEIINHRFKNKEFQAFLKYEENKNEIEKKIDGYSSNIESEKQEISNFLNEKQKNVDTLAKKLENLKNSYNFVLLNQGFEQILKQKNVSKWLLFASVVAMGIITVSPLLYKIYKNSWSEMTWQEIAFGVGLELILIYFFRVILNEYNSVKTQIMQLELRVSLCQFIQSYAEYAKEIKQDDPSALEKFENVVFSNILADSRDMPSTFDSVEQIGNFIKNIKS